MGRILVLFFPLFLMHAGCGVKTNPVPYVSVYPDEPAREPTPKAPPAKTPSK